MKKVMIIVGTRPEGIKMAPVIHACREQFQTVVVNTAQHREMLDSVFQFFNITPNYDLNVMRPGQTLESVSTDVLNGLMPILDKEKPNVVLVHGDTTTTFIGAYAAFLRQIPVAHVEAGLRTYNMYSPYPEEMNRQLVGRIASYHFAATERNREQLLEENVKPQHITVVGNSGIDALYYAVEQQTKLPKELEHVVEKGNRIILVTTHRRENVESLQEVYEALNELLDTFNDVEIVFPVHRNPKVREKVRAHLQQSDRVHLVEPMDYAVFAKMMGYATLIITDSGGIQEEAPALNIPVLVTRNTTERQEGVEAGTLRLVGTSSHEIYKHAVELLQNEEVYEQMAQAKNPYGDGQTSQRIVAFLQQVLNERK